MSYTINLTINNLYHQIDIVGVLLKDTDADDMQIKLIELLRSNPSPTNLLMIDVRLLQFRASVTNTFFRASAIPNDVKSLNVAIIENDEYKDKGTITENMYRNNGLNLRVFLDKGEAESWFITVNNQKISIPNK
ncbi:MAG: hypothetical protein ACK5AS_05210 [Bacteroidota bacterium]|jgi:hypothetical protein|nr:hypothetical protein LBMAG25_06750 [Bacteroidota bacterium]